jgi:hypothetical protein
MIATVSDSAGRNQNDVQLAVSSGHGVGVPGTEMPLESISITETEEGMTETGNERAPSATTWPKCVKRFETCPCGLLLAPSFFPPIHHHPSLPLYYTFTYPSRAFSSFYDLSHAAADFVPSSIQPKKRRNLFLKKL